MLRLLSTLVLSLWLSAPAAAGTFQDLGIPVTKAGLMGAIVGPDEKGEMTRLYFNFNQSGAPLFLVEVDPATGQTRQFNAPEGPGAWGFIVGPDNKIYLGTWDGGLILRFDPANPDKGIEVVGKPSPTEQYIWMYTIGADKKLYGCTYPNAKIISYDPATGQMADLGRMDPTEQYSRSIAADRDGWVYVGIGMSRGSIVAYEIKTLKHQFAMPQSHIIQGCGRVYCGTDGRVYGELGAHHYRMQNGKAEEIAADQAASEPPQQLQDGRILTGSNLEGVYTLQDPKTGKSEEKKFAYSGAGSGIFVVGEGPGGVIYGSTAMPLELFSYDRLTREMKNPGNPTPVVLDAKQKKIIHKASVDLGYPLEISLQRWKDGRIYGLTDRCIFTIDPQTFEVTEFARPAQPITCGWAITDTGIYFGSHVNLMRYAW